MEREEQDSIVVEGSLDGMLNGLPLRGGFHGFFDAPTNILGGLVFMEDIPELESALLASSCTSAYSSVCCVFSRATNGAANLISIMGAPFDVDIEYHMVDTMGALVGRVHQTSELSMAAPGRGDIRVTIKGWLDGPKDIHWSPGYPIYPRQDGPDVIEGVYGQTIFTGSDHFYALCRRRYRYLSPRMLPCDEVWHYKLLKLDIGIEGGLRKFDFRSTAYYSPAEGSHGEFPDEEYSEVLRRDILVPAGNA